MDAAAQLAMLVELGHAGQAITYMIVASFAFLLADHLETFPLEVSMIWSSKWSLGKVLFLLTRYSVLLDLPLGGFYNLGSNLSLDTCRSTFAAGAVLTVVGVTISEAVLFLRVYALAGRGLKAGVPLSILYVAVHIALFVFLGKFLNSLEYAPSPIPDLLTCLPIKSHNIMLSIVFALILGSELIILAVTFWIGYQKYEGSKSPLISIFYRDGVSYFACTAAISAGNIICNLAAPPGYIFLLAIPQRVAHSILSSRMILHMRDLNRGAYESATEVQLTALELQSRLNRRNNINLPQKVELESGF